MPDVKTSAETDSGAIDGTEYVRAIRTADAGVTWTNIKVLFSRITTYLRGIVGAYSKQQYAAQAILTDAANIAWNLDTAQAAKVTLGGNRALSAPTNQHAGATYTLLVVQDGTGSRTLSFDAIYKFAGGTDPTLSTGAGAVDILTFLSDGTSMYGGSILNLS